MVRRTRLTHRQAEVLAFVEKQHRDTGICPSHKEIAAHFGFSSTNSVREHLRLIEQKGFLSRIPGISRSVQVTKRYPINAAAASGIPLLGAIPAGPPLEAIQEAETTIPVSPGIFHGANLFALRVRGQSMVGAGILDGDIAVLSAQAEVAPGDIAAVCIDNEATLKRVLRTPQGVTLHAENPAFPDTVFSNQNGQDLRIAGRLVGIIRAI